MQCRGPLSSRLLLTAGLLFCSALPLLAATGGGGDMPWDPLLDALVANIGGRTLRNILILAIIGAGIGFYFAAEGSWIRSAFALIIGFSIATAAATWGPAFFGTAAASTPHTPLPRALDWADGITTVLHVGTWLMLVVAIWGRVRDLTLGGTGLQCRMTVLGGKPQV